ncbi:alpha-amylase [Jeotgalicoccus huakuii]|nr:alpha-amylase [Jeotgalicoccus huakuii]
MRKKLVWGIITVIVLSVLLLPLVDKTASTTRVIIDNTTKEIVHPSCYDQADLTNWIDEVSFGRAIDELEYDVRDECSKEHLEEGKTSVLMRVLE